jgi:putative flippase GtrA
MQRLTQFGSSTEFVRYLLVGALTFGTYFALLLLTFSVLRLPYQLALSASYATSVALHFIANRRYTFRSKGRATAIQAFRYSVVLVLNYFIQLGVVYGIHVVAQRSFYAGAVVAILTTLVVGFVLMRGWVFGPVVRPPQAEHPD